LFDLDQASYFYCAIFNFAGTVSSPEKVFSLSSPFQHRSNKELKAVYKLKQLNGKIMKNTIKAFKAFDKNMQCRGFQYEEGQVYEMDGEPILCEHGFHFCKDLVLTLAYYPAEDINDNFYAEVEIIGDVVYEEPTNHKGATNKIKILRIIPCEEVSGMVDGNSNSGNSNSGYSNSGDSNSGNRNSGNRNSGDSNSGNRNSGNRNSGYSNSSDSNSGDSNSGNRNSGNRNSGYSNSGNRNSGNRNSGDWNSGNRNSGDWNSGDWNSSSYESGAFNSIQSDTIRVFNIDCLRSEWEAAYKPDFLYFTPCKDMTYKDSFIKSWKDADKTDRERVKDLPNFDASVFFKISGIDLRD